MTVLFAMSRDGAYTPYAFAFCTLFNRFKYGNLCTIFRFIYVIVLFYTSITCLLTLFLSLVALKILKSNKKSFLIAVL